MVTFHSNVDSDFDRIYDYLRDERNLDEADANAVIDAIYEDAEEADGVSSARRFGLTYLRARNGYLIWFSKTSHETQIYAIYHRREHYDKVIRDRVALSVQD